MEVKPLATHFIKIGKEGSAYKFYRFYNNDVFSDDPKGEDRIRIGNREIYFERERYECGGASTMMYSRMIYSENDDSLVGEDAEEGRIIALVETEGDTYYMDSERSFVNLTALILGYDSYVWKFDIPANDNHRPYDRDLPGTTISLPIGDIWVNKDGDVRFMIKHPVEDYNSTEELSSNIEALILYYESCEENLLRIVKNV